MAGFLEFVVVVAVFTLVLAGKLMLTTWSLFGGSNHEFDEEAVMYPNDMGIQLLPVVVREAELDHKGRVRLFGTFFNPSYDEPCHAVLPSAENSQDILGRDKSIPATDKIVNAYQDNIVDFSR